MAEPISIPQWVPDAVFYQIFPDRFANGDHSLDPTDVVNWDSSPTRHNFFGGDFHGITEHLDDIRDLGANAIYLTPIFAACTNHRYDTIDYQRIDPLLGGLPAFRQFLAEAHKRNMRVVLDGVFNHCGINHWAFRDVQQNRMDSPFVDWFHIQDFPIVHDPVPNYLTCSGCYYLPKWNVYNPAVREHHLAVARRWLEEGIDGWRLDVPYFVPKPFWEEFRRTVHSINPDAYIVAEEWRDPLPWLDGKTADATMNYRLRDAILSFTAERSTTAFQLARQANNLYQRTPVHARTSMLNLLGSHDTERVLTRHHGNVQQLLGALALLVASAGIPMIYYGDEIGMIGDNDPGCRGSMRWDKDSWNQKIYRTVQTLISMRKRRISLRRGEQSWIALDKNAVAVKRSFASERTILIVNRADEPYEVSLARLMDNRNSAPQVLYGMRQNSDSGRLTVPPSDFILLAEKEDAFS